MKTIAAFLIALSLLSCSSYALNQNAEDFSLKDINGKVFRLSDYRGKVVFLNFFATWCPPCREEMPSIQKLNGLDLHGFRVVTVAVDRNDPDGVRSFISKNNYTFKVLLDGENTVSDKYGIVSIPTTFIIDSKGRIKEKVIGGRDWMSEESVREFRKLAAR